jgi:hypothetical protein
MSKKKRKNHGHDPKVAPAATGFTSKPELQKYAELADDILEARAMEVLYRPDFKPLLLSPAEMAPALAMLDLRAQKFRSTLLQGKPVSWEMNAELQTIWMEVIPNCLPQVLTPARRARLVQDLEKYAKEHGNGEAAANAHMALLLLQCTPDDRQSKFLFGYVLRSMLSTFEEKLFGNRGIE